MLLPFLVILVAGNQEQKKNQSRMPLLNNRTKIIKEKRNMAPPYITRECVVTHQSKYFYRKTSIFKNGYPVTTPIDNQTYLILLSQCVIINESVIFFNFKHFLISQNPARKTERYYSQQHEFNKARILKFLQPEFLSKTSGIKFFRQNDKYKALRSAYY